MKSRAAPSPGGPSAKRSQPERACTYADGPNPLINMGRGDRLNRSLGPGIRLLTGRVRERWQWRSSDEGFDTRDLTVVHVMSHQPDTSDRVGVSLNPPKLPRHLFQALQDSEDPSFGVYD
jgi:hypothetical protein